MAKKYDLSTIDTRNEGPQRHHPWYKERLKHKFLKTSKQSAALDGSGWTFVASNMDDFRSGLPVKQSKMVRKGQANIVPLIGRKSGSTPTQRMLSGNSGIRTLYERVDARKQMQQELVERVTSSLLGNPLELYPHLKSAIPSDIVEDVADILNPSYDDESSTYVTSTQTKSDSTTTANAAEYSAAAADTHTAKDAQSEETLINPPLEENSLSNPPPIRVPSPPNPEAPRVTIYKFPLMKTTEEKEREMDLIASRQVISAKQQSRVKEVTRDLVQWGAQLTGDDPDTPGPIDEQTIRSLFGGDLESKPVLMAPIRVVELQSIPYNLRRVRSGLPTPSSSAHSYMRHYYGVQCIDSCIPWREPQERPVVRTRYGAWYLPVNKWKFQLSGEPLLDPRLMPTEAEIEAAEKKLELNKQIAGLHGAKAFKEFIAAQCAPIPSFLRSENSCPSVLLTRRKFSAL